VRGVVPVCLRVGLSEEWRRQIDLGRRTRLQRIVVVPRVIKSTNDFGVPVIKAKDWDEGAALNTIVPTKFRKVNGQMVGIPGTPPLEALHIIQEVMDLLAAMELYSMGLPECNGNEMRWRLAAMAAPWYGSVLDFAYQLKQGTILDWLPMGGVGPQAVRGRPVDPLIPQEAPGGYPKHRDFPYECSRLALVYVLTNTRTGYARRVLSMVDCANFINMSQFTIMRVTENPYDFAFGWLAR
jgi:hypothetical protein